MRIDNGLASPISNGNGLGSVGSVGQNSRSYGADGQDQSFDSVRLSSASDLISAAKGTNSTDRQSHVAGIASQVRSGSYSYSSQSVSQSLIDSLL